MDTRPIGIFDSGLGGLTAVKELERLLPNENLVYFGDTGRVPYGSKGSETIKKYALQDIRFLKTFDVKAIIIACGTVSSVAFKTIKDEFSMPIIGVVEPTADAAVKATITGKIGVIGTAATIKTASYEKTIKNLLPTANIISKACPLFVPLVENGYFEENNKIVSLVAHEYLDEFKDKIDTLILGCTHYPLLSSVIKTILPNVNLINSGLETAKVATRILKEKDLLSDGNSQNDTKFYVSDNSGDFANLASIFLEHKVTQSVEKAEIERY